MLISLQTVFAAAALVLMTHSSMQAAQGNPQQQQQQAGQVQGQRGGPGRGQGRGGPPEVERAIRARIENRLRDVLKLPDTTLARLTNIAFRYRDTSIVLMERERFLRREMGWEVDRAGNRAPDDGRITCLMDNYWITRRMQLDLRAAEDRAVAAFLPGIKRLQYFGLIENLNEVIDDVRDNFNERNRGGGGRGGARGGPPVGPDGRALPPPGAGRPGGPPGRAAAMGLCEPRRGG